MGIFDQINIGTAVIARGGALEAGMCDAGTWTPDTVTQVLLVDGFGVHSDTVYFDDLAVTPGDEAQLYLDPSAPRLQVVQ